MTRVRVAIGALTLALLALLFISGPARAAATIPAPTMAGKYWLVKENDAQVIGEGTWTWTGCGITTSPARIHHTGPCLPGQDRIYTSYWTLTRWITAGKQKPGTTVIFDQEGWTDTPLLERRHPAYYLQKACQYAAARRVRMIAAPTTGGLPVVQRAARYCPVLDLQIQYLDGAPRKYAQLARTYVTAIRKISRTVIILAGLAPDAAGRPVPAASMTAEYQATRALVQGYWLNADKWAAGTGCAPEGCGATVRAFLTSIGATP
jgi:hypothetical protein